METSRAVFNFLFLAYCDAYDALDPTGNITIKWDVISWTPDGYVAVVTMFNFQQYRHIQAPGWTLGWTWAKKEVIWAMMGAQTTEQGDCSKYKGNIPHCCKKDPTVVDLLPGTPYNHRLQIAARGDPESPYLASVVAGANKNSYAPLVQCTSHMCPIRIHWHVKLNYKEYWRVKVTITNFNYRMNYSQWNLVVQHPNLDNLTQIFSFKYKPLTPYAAINDTAMLWGVKFYNDFLNQAGPLGNVQSELLFRKDASTFTFEKGWAFPRRIYFNGDNCVMPPP
ncbi:COBRA-like protein 1 precursor [Actinidia rufa]|uniref:COBRA-like protein 1 n=1 Tax=Actinidia rufa TaxID=165716 RepID=A0A7J0HDB0_9ERIC|nr:COBRA-like protein 1 precursor [Actinidia rufa]